MTSLEIGDRVAYRGRVFYVHGFSPMSVTPRKLHLRDAISDELIEVTENELQQLADAKRTSRGRPSGSSR